MLSHEALNQQIELLRAGNERDWLTGVYHRGACRTRVNELIANGGVLILLDICDFKKINEKYGHLAGDRTLQQLAGLLGHMVLKSDIIGRTGGDIFSVFIRGKRDDEFVQARIEQIRTRVAAEQFPDIGSKPIRLICAWTLSEPGDDFDSMYTRAEKRLGENKTNSNDENDGHYRVSVKVDGRKIRGSLKENGAVKGAFYQDLDGFEVLFRYTERLMKRSGRGAFILLLTLVDKDGKMLPIEERGEKMQLLNECIRTTLRVSDVYTRYTSTQFLIMNVDTDMRYTETIASRIRQAFYDRAGIDSKNLLLHESYPMGHAEQEKSDRPEE